jgi:hypothetical protein
MATSKNQKFTEEELNSLKEVRSTFQELSYKLGQLEIQRLGLEEDKANTVKVLEETIVKEKQVAKDLMSKYGKGTIDIDSGEFIPSA